MKNKFIVFSLIGVLAMVLLVGIASQAQAQTVVGGSVLTTSSALSTQATANMRLVLYARQDLFPGISYGTPVASLQAYLNSLGFLAGKVYTVGTFDTSTVDALRAYQLSVHLPPTGYVDRITRAHMSIALLFRANGFTNVF